MNIRPAWIVKMFWMEQLVIEETAEIFEPIYLQEAA